jgi:hypothetical protein
MMRKNQGRRHYRLALMVFAVAAVVLEPVAGLAQQQPGNGACEATPNDGKANGTGQKTAPGQNKDLSDCGGVLKPPTTGDTGMVKPAPEGGKTPVIPPSTQGDQQNGQPQAK